MPVEVVVPGRTRSQDETITIPTMADTRQLVYVVAVAQTIVTVLALIAAMAVQTWILVALL